MISYPKPIWKRLEYSLKLFPLGLSELSVPECIDPIHSDIAGWDIEMGGIVA